METDLNKQQPAAEQAATQPLPEERTADFVRARRDYSRLDLNFVVFTTLGTVLLILVASLYGVISGKTMGMLGQNVLNFAIMYLIAFPCFCFLCRPIEKRPPEKHRLPGWMPVLLFFATEGLMFCGNLIGLGVNAVLSGLLGKNTNVVPISQMLTGDYGWVFVIVAVLGAPVVEELMCRKMLLDRIGHYGEGVAILVSGTVFGLLHGNFVQFFYAFLIGCFFAFIYLRTGNILYTIALHLLTNFFGSAVPLLTIAGTSPEVREVMMKMIGERDSAAYMKMVQENASALRELAPFLLYTVLNYVFVIIGIILLIVFFRQLKTQPVAEPVAKGQRLKAAFVNIGFLLFLISSIVEFAIQVFL